MKGTLRAILVCLLAGAILPALAEKTRYWRQSAIEDFAKGAAKGVAMRSDGRLSLAPRFAQFADPNLAYLWALRADSKGNLYAAGGSNARVLRFDAKGKATTVFESQDLAAQALAVDRKDNLYVGTSPDGKVYKVTPKGESSVFFEPNTKYIWDLAFDASGTLYVATGDKGEIYAVQPDGKGEILLKSDETHIRALSFDAKGNLIAGTDPSGLILRLERSREGVRAFVLYETARKEVTALVADADGNLYGAAIGQKTPTSKTIAQQQALIQQAAAQAAAAAAAAAQQQQQAGQAGRQQIAIPPPTQFVPFAPTSGGSEVYRIAPDGAPEVLWSSNDKLVYSLALGPRGRILMGTGNDGSLIEIEGNSLYSSLAETASDQLTGMLAGPGGKVYLCTANPGKIFALGPDFESEGTFESEPFDAKIFSQWGRLTWWGDNGSTRGQVQFYLRTGNTSNPEQNWSAWAGPLNTPEAPALNVPAARFAQWKAVFKAPAAGEGTPSIGWVSLAYLPKNLAPVLGSIVVQDPGVRVQGVQAAQAGISQQMPMQLRVPQPIPGQNPVASRTIPPQRFEPPPQGFAQRGYQGVVWAADDENDDDLRYAIYYRGEHEAAWKLLKDNLDQKFYSWETSTMPDGAYYLKVVASDALSNPAGEGLSAERISDRFEVDNTPPSVTGLKAEAMSPDVRVRFQAADSYSAVARTEYSLDAGDWTLLLPTDRVSDAPQEEYEVLLRGLAGGEHTLAVRVFDQFENVGSAKVTFTVESGKKK